MFNQTQSRYTQAVLNLNRPLNIDIMEVDSEEWKHDNFRNVAMIRIPGNVHNSRHSTAFTTNVVQQFCSISEISTSNASQQLISSPGIGPLFGTKDFRTISNRECNVTSINVENSINEENKEFKGTNDAGRLGDGRVPLCVSQDMTELTELFSKMKIDDNRGNQSAKQTTPECIIMKPFYEYVLQPSSLKVETTSNSSFPRQSLLNQSHHQLYESLKYMKGHGRRHKKHFGKFDQTSVFIPIQDDPMRKSTGSEKEKRKSTKKKLSDSAKIDDLLSKINNKQRGEKGKKLQHPNYQLPESESAITEYYYRNLLFLNKKFRKRRNKDVDANNELHMEVGQTRGNKNELLPVKKKYRAPYNSPDLVTAKKSSKETEYRRWRHSFCQAFAI